MRILERLLIYLNARNSYNDFEREVLRKEFEKELSEIVKND